MMMVSVFLLVRQGAQRAKPAIPAVWECSFLLFNGCIILTLTCTYMASQRPSFPGIAAGKVFNILHINDVLLQPSASHLLLIKVIIFMTQSTDCSPCSSHRGMCSSTPSHQCNTFASSCVYIKINGLSWLLMGQRIGSQRSHRIWIKHFGFWKRVPGDRICPYRQDIVRRNKIQYLYQALQWKKKQYETV